VVPISSDRHWDLLQTTPQVAGTCLTVASLIACYQPRRRVQPRARPLRPRPRYIKSHSAANYHRRFLTLTSQSVVIRNCLRQWRHHCRRVGSGDPALASAVVGVRGASFLTWKADSWILVIRDGRGLVQDVADFDHEVGLHFLSRVTVVSVEYLTLLLHPHCSIFLHPVFYSCYPFLHTAGISAAFFYLLPSCQLTLRRFHD